MKSLAGVAAKIRPFCFTFSPGDNTPEIAELPDLMIEPIAFSTMFDNPPFLFPGVVFALRSAPPRFRYVSYHCISRMIACATSALAGTARQLIDAVSNLGDFGKTSPSRPHAPAESVAKPTAGFAVSPENASLPPHCTPITRSPQDTFRAAADSAVRDDA